MANRIHPRQVLLLAQFPRLLSADALGDIISRGLANGLLAYVGTANGLKLKLNVAASPKGGLSRQKIEETNSALRELEFRDQTGECCQTGSEGRKPWTEPVKAWN